MSREGIGLASTTSHAHRGEQCGWDYGQVPPKWRSGTCMLSAFCHNPEISPDAMGIVERPGVSLWDDHEGDIS